jgi:bacterioferritin-associated ferredoxin
MIVCHCFAASDADLYDAIRQGAHDLERVGAVCGAGTGCGGCHAAIEDVFVRSDVLVALPAAS